MVADAVTGAELAKIELLTSAIAQIFDSSELAACVRDHPAGFNVAAIARDCPTCRASSPPETRLVLLDGGLSAPHR